MKGHNLTAKKIEMLLASKHAKDIFVSQCKNAMTGSGLGILDAWVMKRTWNPITTIGYEIKISRSDFLRDDKWQKYLEDCHQFYFVCPWGLIDPVEVPPEAGLMYVAKTGTRFYTKKKPAYRDIRPYHVLIYILMTRTRIIDDRFGYDESNIEYWRRWLEEKKDNQELGHRVRGKINELAAKAFTDKHLAERRVEKWGEFKKKLIAIGIDPDAQIWEFERKINELTGKIPRRLEHELRRAADNLNDIANVIDKLKAKSDEQPET